METFVRRDGEEPKIARVLVIVRGGVAEVFSDKTADVVLIDYDNEPAASIPRKYADLLRE